MMSNVPSNLREVGERILSMDRTRDGNETVAVEMYRAPDGRIWVTRVLRSIEGGQREI